MMRKNCYCVEDIDTSKFIFIDCYKLCEIRPNRLIDDVIQKIYSNLYTENASHSTDIFRNICITNRVCCFRQINIILDNHLVFGNELLFVNLIENNLRIFDEFLENERTYRSYTKKYYEFNIFMVYYVCKKFNRSYPYCKSTYMIYNISDFILREMDFDDFYINHIELSNENDDIFNIIESIFKENRLTNRIVDKLTKIKNRIINKQQIIAKLIDKYGYTTVIKQIRIDEECFINYSELMNPRINDDELFHILMNNKFIMFSYKPVIKRIFSLIMDRYNECEQFRIVYFEFISNRYPNIIVEYIVSNNFKEPKRIIIKMINASKDETKEYLLKTLIKANIHLFPKKKK